MIAGAVAQVIDTAAPEADTRNRIGEEDMEFKAHVDVSELPGQIQAAYFNFIRSIWDHGTIDGQIKEMIRMRSAILVDCKQ